MARVNDPWATQAPAPAGNQPLIEEEQLYYDYLTEYDNANRSPGATEYDYQYYDTPGTLVRGSGNRQEKDLDEHRPAVVLSAAKSKPATGYVISTNVGSQSTIKPVIISTTPISVVTERPKISSTTKRTTAYNEPTTSTPESVFISPFKANFEVGKPVVSISSTSTSSRFEVSSPRYSHSTPRYGYFSVAQPSSTSKFVRQTSTTSTTSTTPRPAETTRKIVRTTTTEKPVSREAIRYEKVKEFRAEDLESYSDSEDPFAYIDWKKDPSSVTATTKTRYETAFGPAAVERKLSSTIKPIARRRIVSTSATEAVPSNPENTAKTVRVSSSSSSSIGSKTFVTATRLTGRRRPRNRLFGRRRENTELVNNPPVRRKRIYSGPSRQDFSNFRYFKTAFGDAANSESAAEAPKRPNRSRLASIPAAEPSVLSRRRGNYEEETPTKTASRNTRYSIYA